MTLLPIGPFPCNLILSQKLWHKSQFYKICMKMTKYIYVCTTGHIQNCHFRINFLKSILHLNFCNYWCAKFGFVCLFSLYKNVLFGVFHDCTWVSIEYSTREDIRCKTSSWWNNEKKICLFGTWVIWPIPTLKQFDWTNHTKEIKSKICVIEALCSHE